MRVAAPCAECKCVGQVRTRHNDHCRQPTKERTTLIKRITGLIKPTTNKTLRLMYRLIEKIVDCDTRYDNFIKPEDKAARSRVACRSSRSSPAGEDRDAGGPSRASAVQVHAHQDSSSRAAACTTGQPRVAWRARARQNAPRRPRPTPPGARGCARRLQPATQKIEEARGRAQPSGAWRSARSRAQRPEGGSTASAHAIVHFGSVGRLWGLFERSKAT